MTVRFRGAFGILAVLSAFVLSSTAFASSKASVTIQQISGKSLGSWVLNAGDGTMRHSTDPGVNPANHALGLTEFGPTTIAVTPPNGMSARIGIYRGGEFLKTVDLPQYSFTLYPNDNYRFLVQYSLDRLGSFGVTSDPSGVRFRMKGRGTKTYSAVTPFTFKNIPTGQYSLSMSAPAGCTQPAPHSAFVENEKRNTLHVTINCVKNQTGSVVERIRPTKRSLVEHAEQREFNPRGNRK